MTRAEFIENYGSSSNTQLVGAPDSAVMIPPFVDHPGYVALPCNCGEDVCKGWAKVRNDPESIADHNHLYA